MPTEVFFSLPHFKNTWPPPFKAPEGYLTFWNSFKEMSVICLESKIQVVEIIL